MSNAESQPDKQPEHQPDDQLKPKPGHGPKGQPDDQPKSEPDQKPDKGADPLSLRCKILAFLIHFSIFFLIVCIVSTLATFGIYYASSKSHSSASVSFSVSNPRALTLSDGDPFVEPGYSASFCLTSSSDSCSDISDYVIVNNPHLEEINSATLGEYTVDYSLEFSPQEYSPADFALWADTYSFSDSRTVTVVDQAPPEITLEGDAELVVYLGEEYYEPGYSASDTHDGDLTDKVSVEGRVDTSSVGTYTLTYTVSDSSGNPAEPRTRTVSVRDEYHAWYAAQLTQTNNFDELRDYIEYNGWNIAFGFYNLDTGYTYTYRADDLFYGASLVKTIDAMYAYETGQVYDRGIISQTITYSNNSAHISMVNALGIDNLRSYAQSIGMTHHLQPSQIYSDTYYFCDTSVNDQIAEWKHLWYLINNLDNGWELRNYFINNYWDNLSFDGSPTHMYKNGLYGSNYHETGIIFADSPYIVTFLSTEGWRWNSTYIMKDLSHRTFLINEGMTK